MTPKETQEILLIGLFRLKILMDRYKTDPIISQELQHIFQGLKEGLSPELLPNLWQPQKVELPRIEDNKVRAAGQQHANHR